jgi:hypothetical protein
MSVDFCNVEHIGDDITREDINQDLQELIKIVCELFVSRGQSLAGSLLLFIFLGFNVFLEPISIILV